VFHHLGDAAQSGQQLVSLGPQLVIVVVDACNDRLQLVQATELSAQALIVLGEVLDLLVQHTEKLTPLIQPTRDVLSLRVHGAGS
jgi:hypothetical protein